MNSNNEIPNDLMVRFLAGECSFDEQELLEKWLKQSDENQKIFDDCKKIWEFQPENTAIKINADAAWKEVERRIGNDAHSVSQKIRPVWYLSAVAAAVLFLLGFYILMINTQPNQVQFFANQNTSEPMILPDNSQVFLNNGSKVTFPEYFTGKLRNIALDGEAFFVVTPDASKAFIVKLGETEVKVLGTSFNIADRAGTNTIELAVLTGKVVFYPVARPDDKIILSQGEMGIYDKIGGEMRKEPLKNQNFLAWRTKVLEFDQTPLTTVLAILEKTYGITIKSERNISDLKLTARFSNDTPEDIFKTLAMIFGFEIEQSNKNFIIK